MGIILVWGKPDHRIRSRTGERRAALEDRGYNTRIGLLFRPSCRNMYLLSVALVEVTTDDDGKTSESEDVVVENLLIGKDDYDKIRSNWAG